MKLTAISKVLAQYKITETGVITKEMIQAAWDELLEAEARLKEVGDDQSSVPGKDA